MMKILYVTRNLNKSGFAVLDRLIKEKFNIVGVVLHDSDTCVRNNYQQKFIERLYRLKCWYYRCEALKTTKSEYLLAQKNNLEIVLTRSIKSAEFFDKLKMLHPDIIVVGGGWHELIPERIFNFPKLGCINLHPSLLPEFKGTSITRWQVLKGVRRSGCTIHVINENFDEGEILAQDAIFVSEEITPQCLFHELGVLGAEMMAKLLHSIKKTGLPKPISPNGGEHQEYFSKWSWSDEKLKINWKCSLDQIHFMVLANTQESYQYPGPFFHFNNQSFILRKTKLHRKDNSRYECDLNQASNEITVIKKTDTSVFLYRMGEDFVLELVQVQKKDKFFKLRRAQSASNQLNFNVGDHLK